MRQVRMSAGLRYQAFAGIDQNNRQTELDTQTAYLNLNSSIAQVNAYQQALIGSQRQLDSTKTGHDVGVSTFQRPITIIRRQTGFVGSALSIFAEYYSLESSGWGDW